MKLIKMLMITAIGLMLFAGVALAQTEDAAPTDPQTMCEEAGGVWNPDDEALSCYNVWCGWETDPPICDWMEQQRQSSPQAEQPAPVTPTQAEPAAPTPAVPTYTG